MPSAETAPEPADEALERPAPAAKGKPGLSGAGGMAKRIALIVAGVSLVAGFFLPWFTLGGVASVSGLALLFADGAVVDTFSGPHRFLLFAVPLLGALLVAGAIAGHRIVVWLALATGLFVLGDGLITLMRLFLHTTGAGMWMVIFGALVATATGLLSLGRRR